MLSYRRVSLFSIAVLACLTGNSASQTPLVGAHAVQIWNVLDGKRELALSENAPVFCVAFSPDQSKLATAGADGIRLWNLGTGQTVWHQPPAGNRIIVVTFSPDGSQLLSSDERGVVKLWDAKSGEDIRTFGGADLVYAVAFSPDGHFFASGGNDGAVRIWHVSTGREVRQVAGHSRAIRSLIFSPDGRLLAAGSDDGSIRIWDPSTGRETTKLEKPVKQSGGGSEQASVLALAFSPDGTKVAAGSADHTCTVWSAATGELLRSFLGHSYAVTSVSFRSDDGGLLATGGLDHSIRIWNANTGQELASLVTSEGPVSSLAFSRDGKHLATATNFAELNERTLYVLSIGISHYRDARQRLRYPAADAAAIASAFQKSSASIFDRINFQLLLDEDATRARIIGALEHLARVSRPSDTVIFFFSGHDIRTDDGSIFLPADGNVESGISSSVLIRFLNRLPPQRQLIILDCYDGGASFKDMDAGIRRQKPELLELTQRSTAVLAPLRASYEHPELMHGLLTYAVLKGLSGNAARSGVVTAESLLSYVVDSSGELTEGKEWAMSFLSGIDFPLASAPTLPEQDRGKGESRYAPDQPPALRGVRYKPSPRSMSTRQVQNDRGFATPKQSAAPDSALPPRHDYAVIFAGTHYDRETGWSTLEYPQKDADAVRDVLRDAYGFEVEIVPDSDQDTILAKLREYRTKKSYGPEDQLLVMFAGHGAADDVDGYIVARNSRQSDKNFTSYISFSNLHTILDNMPSRHVLLVLDTCFDGAFEPKSLSSLRLRVVNRYQLVMWYPAADVEAGSMRLSTFSWGDPGYPPNDGGQDDREELIHSKLRYKTRWYMVSGGREPVPDKSAFIQKFLDALRKAAASDGVLTAQQVYSSMQWGLKPQPHESGFGSNEPWSDFVFESRHK